MLQFQFVKQRVTGLSSNSHQDNNGHDVYMNKSAITLVNLEQPIGLQIYIFVSSLIQKIDVKRDLNIVQVYI